MGYVVTKESLEVDQRCRDDFNTWYWNRVNLKEGKKLVSKGISTCDSSVHELFNGGSTEKCCNNYCKYVGNSSESVILGEKIFKRSVGTQASVSVVKGKHDDIDGEDGDSNDKEP